MITVQDMERLLFAGGDVVGDDGKKIGSLGQLFLDARTGNPAWVTVTTGLFGKAETFVPMTGAELHGSELHVPYGKDVVKHAPRIHSADGHLSPAEERDLYRHYGLLHDDPADSHDDERGSRTEDRTEAQGTVGHATVPAVPVPTNAPAPVAPTSPGPPPRASYDGVRAHADATAGTADDGVGGDDGVAVEPDRDGMTSGTSLGGATAVSASAPAPAPEGMVLEGEQARVVGTERVPTERVRMRRYTVTEHKQITVPVQREEVRVEYEPADDGVLPDAAAGDTPSARAVDPSRTAGRAEDDRS